MPAYYTIVQCVPDPVLDERINVGVIVYGDGRIRSRFVSDWRRVRNFGVEDVEFLREFAVRLQLAESGQQHLPAMPALQRFDEDSLQRVIGSWSNSIQFSEPKGSLRDPAVVLEDVAGRFLREVATVKREIRTRTTAASLAQRTVLAGFAEFLDQRKVEHYVRKYPEIPGKLDDHHRLDVGVANGKWHFAVHGLSFELHDVDQMEADYQRAVFAVSDIQNRIQDLKLGVLFLPPREDTGSRIVSVYRRAEQAFSRADIEILTEESAQRWVDLRVAQLPRDEFELPEMTAFHRTTSA